MAVVFFGMRSFAKYQRKTRAPGCIVDPVSGYVNVRIGERKGLTKHQSQFVGKSRFFSKSRSV
jgi:hypothetical protein